MLRAFDCMLAQLIKASSSYQWRPAAGAGTHRGGDRRRDEAGGLAVGRVDVVDVDVLQRLVGLRRRRVALVRVRRAGAEVAVPADAVRRLVGDERVRPEEVVHALGVRPVVDHRVPDLHRTRTHQSLISPHDTARHANYCSVNHFDVLVSFTLRAATYHDALEVDRRRGLGGVAEDGVGELGDVVAGVALAGEVEVAALVLGELLHPVEQEQERVLGGLVVAAPAVVRRRVGVGEPHAGGALQEQHVRRVVPRVRVPVQRLAVALHAERAQLLHGAVPQRRAPGAAVQPEEERPGRRGNVAGGLGEVVEQRAPGRGVHRHVPGVLREVHALGLPRQPVHAVVLLAPHPHRRRVPLRSARRRRDRQRRLGLPRLAPGRRRPAQAVQVVTLPRPGLAGRGRAGEQQREAERRCQRQERQHGPGGGPHGACSALSGGYGAGRARARRTGGRPVYIGTDGSRAAIFSFFFLFLN
jgi:hypothetical protein